MAEAIVGRVSLRCIVDPLTGETIVQRNELVTPDIALRTAAIGFEEIVVRSPLTCQTEQGVCRYCYGRDPSTAFSPGDLIDRVALSKINQALQSRARVVDPGDSEYRTRDIISIEFIDETNRKLEHSNMKAAEFAKARLATGHIRILGIEEVAKQRDAMKRVHAIAKNG